MDNRISHPKHATPSTILEYKAPARDLFTNHMQSGNRFCVVCLLPSSAQPKSNQIKSKVRIVENLENKRSLTT